jgi:hypothetical protein
MIVENCIVGIGPQGSVPVGAGFLVTENHVMTCAHVVNVSSGYAEDSQDQPADPVSVMFFADDSGTPILAKVKKKEHWRPPLPDGKPTSSQDMAILTLEGAVPMEAVSAPLRERYPLSDKAFSVSGFPAGWTIGEGQSGIIGERDAVGRYALLEGKATKRLFLRAGYSGAPVRIESALNKGAVGIVGMIVAARSDDQDKTAYMIATEDLANFVSQLDHVNVRNGIVDDFPHIKQIEKHLRETVLKTRTGPPFDLRITTCDSVEAIAQLFRKDPEPHYGALAWNPDRLLNEDGPHLLLLQSPGGAGKSNFLVDVVTTAVSRGMVPFFLDATKAREKIDPASTSLKVLLENLTVGGGLEDFQKAREHVGKERVVLLADRLNENPEQAMTLLKAIIRSAESEATGTIVIVTDRVKDRGEVSQFERATMLPLPLNEIEEHLSAKPSGTNAKLLAMPFFLEMQLRVGGVGSFLIRSEMFREFLRVHADITGPVLPRLAESAFNAYKDCSSTVIPLDTWMGLMKKYAVPDAVWPKVLDGAMLQYKINAIEEVVEFRHQLLHDFLAGTHLANGGQAFWRAPNFDTATLDTQSFDGIEFAAEQLGANATEFLIQVYDWNWLGVLETVRNLDAGRHGGESHISPEFKDALYFLNAMRLFDCFEDSRKRTRSIIADVRTTTGADLDSVRSFADLRKLLEASYKPTETYFTQWKAFFLRDDAHPVSISELSVLWSDPFMSWTATRIFRQSRLDGSVPGFVQMMYGCIKSTGGDRAEAVGARWRFVHLLGVIKDPQTSEFLWSVTVSSDEDKNVRAGAVRSYIENATLIGSREERQAMFVRIADWIATTKDIPGSISRQLRTSARLASDNARDYWDIDYLKVIEAGIRHATDERDLEEKEAWQRRKDEILAQIPKEKN